jgi:hypothetical protein
MSIVLFYPVSFTFEYHVVYTADIYVYDGQLATSIPCSSPLPETTQPFSLYAVEVQAADGTWSTAGRMMD